MQRRDVLRGLGGGVVLGVAGVSTGGTATAHPGPYRPLGSVAVTNAKEAVPDEAGDFAYVATTDGFAVVDVQVPSDPLLVAERADLLSERDTGPLRDVQDVALEGDRLLVAGPADPLEGDVLQGVVVYDVSDPENPEQVAFHETQYPIHNCFLSGGVAFLTGNDGQDNPLVMVDVSDGDPEEVGRWSLLDRDSRWSKVPAGIRTVHDVWVQDGRAYLAHWDAGTWLVDVSDPADPSAVSQVGGRPLDELTAVADDAVRADVFRLPGNDHYAMANDDGTLLGVNREAWQYEGEGGPGGVELWDVSNPDSPSRLATIEAPASPDPGIGGVWTTSHNFDLVGDRLFTSWYQGGVKIHDISDPANPEQLAWWRRPSETSFWTAKRTTADFFLASSMGRPIDDKGGLYTFPIHAGQQKRPQTLTTTDRSVGGQAPTTASGASSGESGTTTAAADASGRVPGFGIPTAVAALLGAGAWWRGQR